MTPRQSLASRMRDRIRIERPVADDSLDGAGSGSWVPIDVNPIVHAEIVDLILQSKAERITSGVNLATRPSRVRMRQRGDVTAKMRFVEVVADENGDDSDGRIMQIVAGPAKLGRDGLEFLVEEYSPAGNPA